MVSNGRTFTKEMLEKDESNNFKKKVNPLIPRGIVVNPPAFGPKKVWEHRGGQMVIKKKYRKDYWELHYLRTGQMVYSPPPFNPNSDFPGRSRFVQEFMKCKMEYLRRLKLYYDSR